MGSALPSVTDCGCPTTTTSSIPTTGGCCPIVGILDPNSSAVLPANTSLWATYLQLTDLINGPAKVIWFWNPHLNLWQKYLGPVWRYWENVNDNNTPPADTTLAVERRFYNGDPPVVWSPQLLTWL